ncbi:MAG: sodium:solute symporter, partial [Oscillospiraceae bacterium]|nr:sodium:solute symporter [Oscillospiraceae bacterium]
IGIALVHMVLFSLGFFPELVDAVKALNCPLNLLSPINAGAIAMILSIVEVPLISMFTKAPAKEVVDEAFKALEK